jgi:mandelate racemase
VTATRLSVRAVSVPMRRPLSTSASIIRQAPLLLIDLTTDVGVTGRSYVFCYDVVGQQLMAQVLRDAADLITGKRVDPQSVRKALARRWRLFGNAGPVAMALSGIDVAMYDTLAQYAGQPLVRFLGGIPTAVDCYNSNGLGLIGPAKAAVEAVELVEEGYAAIKLRLGYPTLADDIAAVRAVRDAVGKHVALLVDYNQVLDREEGLRRCVALDTEGIAWIEEPIVHDDYAGAAAIAARVSTPIQIGENLSGAHAVVAATSAGASDLLMFDLQRIGGISGWLEAAAVPQAMPLSSHLFPEVSVHLLALSPHRDRLEVVDWAAPVLLEPLAIRDGRAIAPDRPGTGIVWDEDAVQRYLV